MKAFIINDVDVVRDTITNQKVYPYVIDDGSPNPENYRPDMDKLLHIGIDDNGEYLGLFALHQHNYVLYEVHTCLLPCSWGERAVVAAKTLIKWVFDNTTCKRLITSIPDNNPLAKRLAKNAGMKQYGINTDSFQKNGVLFDQIMLGISKEDLCQ